MPVPPRNQPWWEDPAWRSIPAALAVVDGERVVARNTRCRRVLESMLGPRESVWDRWLVAAVVRIRIAGDERQTLAVGPEDPRRIQLSLGESFDSTERRIVELRPLDADPDRAADLVESISTLSHEFRTPLAAMKSSLGLLQAGEAGEMNADQQRFLGLTVRNIDRLDRLVRDLLDVARADAGHLPMHIRDVDLTSILAETVELHGSDAREAGLELALGPMPEAFRVRVDADKVLQMLSNVLGNSVKYCEPGDRIRIDLETEADSPGSGEFRLIVRDSGPGIAPNRLREVFAPFCRAHDESSGRVFGAGLGLHITRGLVEAHGGTIALDSEPGRGTTVTLRLPRAPAESVAPVDESASRQESPESETVFSG